MTISSLLKKIVGVKGVVIDGEEIEEEAGEETLVIDARPTKYESSRCPICGRKCPLYDQGKGERRWRSLDVGNSLPVIIKAKAPRIQCEKHGVLVQRFPWARHGARFTRIFEDTGVWLSLYASRKTVSEYLRVSWDTVGPMISRVEAGIGIEESVVSVFCEEVSFVQAFQNSNIAIGEPSVVQRVVKIGLRLADENLPVGYHSEEIRSHVDVFVHSWSLLQKSMECKREFAATVFRATNDMEEPLILTCFRSLGLWSFCM